MANAKKPPIYTGNMLLDAALETTRLKYLRKIVDMHDYYEYDFYADMESARLEYNEIVEKFNAEKDHSKRMILFDKMKEPLHLYEEKQKLWHKRCKVNGLNHLEKRDELRKELEELGYIIKFLQNGSEDRSFARKYYGTHELFDTGLNGRSIELPDWIIKRKFEE